MPAIVIKYCKVWNYEPRAARVAAAVKRAVGIEPDLVVGNRGEFTVWVDGKQVAGKAMADDDIVKAVHVAAQ